MGDDYKDVIPEKEVVKVGNSEVEIGELSIEQTIKLSRFMARKFFDITKGISNSDLKKITINDLLDVVVTNLNEEELLSLLSIITTKDKGWWKQNFKLAAALKVVRKVLEGEDIGEVFTEGLQIMRLLQKTVLDQIKGN